MGFTELLKILVIVHKWRKTSTKKKKKETADIVLLYELNWVERLFWAILKQHCYHSLDTIVIVLVIVLVTVFDARIFFLPLHSTKKMFMYVFVGRTWILQFFKNLYRVILRIGKIPLRIHTVKYKAISFNAKTFANLLIAVEFWAR